MSLQNSLGLIWDILSRLCKVQRILCFPHVDFTSTVNQLYLATQFRMFKDAICDWLTREQSVLADPSTLLTSKHLVNICSCFVPACRCCDVTLVWKVLIGHMINDKLPPHAAQLLLWKWHSKSTERTHIGRIWRKIILVSHSQINKYRRFVLQSSLKSVLITPDDPHPFSVVISKRKLFTVTSAVTEKFLFSNQNQRCIELFDLSKITEKVCFLWIWWTGPLSTDF